MGGVRISDNVSQGRELAYQRSIGTPRADLETTQGQTVVLVILSIDWSRPLRMGY
jgi:hypothetical protein